MITVKFPHDTTIVNTQVGKVILPTSPPQQAGECQSFIVFIHLLLLIFFSLPAPTQGDLITSSLLRCFSAAELKELCFHSAYLVRMVVEPVFFSFGAVMFGQYRPVHVSIAVNPPTLVTWLKLLLRE